MAEIEKQKGLEKELSDLKDVIRSNHDEILDLKLVLAQGKGAVRVLIFLGTIVGVFASLAGLITFFSASS
jgi:hypothetical protein|tara:strand:+ start:1102 stop:1311 length:210 start_codon:yes stop_codon:yes gene_type:complete